MKKTIALTLIFLSGCTAKYDATQIKFIDSNWQSTNANLTIGKVNYIPNSGFSQRTFAVSGGILLGFMDIGRDIDINVSELAHLELNRALKERMIPTHKDSSQCSLNADVYYLKMDKLGNVYTTIRYELTKSGAPLYKAKVDSKYDLNLFSDAYSEAQILANGIHKNINDLLDQKQLLEALNSKCS